MTKLPLSSLLAFSLFCVPACAAETAPTPGAGEQEPAVGQSESGMLTCWSNGLYICYPDLYVKYSTSVQYAPGNPGNIAPGTYITYYIANKGLSNAGPFTTTVTDYFGNVLKTEALAGLAVGSFATISIVAPYYDGWTRTAVVDANHDVHETNETNNTFTLQTGLSPFP